MLSLQFIRENPEAVREALAKRRMEAPLDELLALDQERRRLLHEAETLRAERNSLSKEIGQLTRLLQDENAPGRERRHAEHRRADLLARSGFLSERLEGLEAELRGLEGRLERLLLEVPNLPDPRVPEGEGEEDNVIVRQWGEPRSFDFPPRPHWELGEALGIIDFQGGVKLAGSRFYVLRGLGARLQRALIMWMLDFHNARGYQEVYPPALVREEGMWKGGWLPKFAENMYHDAEEDLWLIPTAEVALTNLHRDEILPPGSLPIYYAAYTPCFRREKFSAGRDVRGIKRVHQFDKVELYKFVEPERSAEELERLVEDASALLRELGLPHRVVLLCSAELGFNAAMTYDIEAWAPGSGEWLEVSSCSNCTDFQARRANIRFRREKGARPEYVHTLNGSGLALPRTMIALLENYQQPDGTVLVPQVLQPYMGGVKVIG
jgi:seryl-tRNA synthetase